VFNLLAPGWEPDLVCLCLGRMVGECRLIGVHRCGTDMSIQRLPVLVALTVYMQILRVLLWQARALMSSKLCILIIVVVVLSSECTLVKLGLEFLVH
jgi:hypothetical protein